ANGLSDAGGASMGDWNVSVHDMVIDDIDVSAYAGAGFFAQQSTNNPNVVLHNVTLNHVTAFSDPKFDTWALGNTTSNQMYGFVWTNNIVIANTGIGSTGGTSNCAYQQGSPLNILNACFASYVFSNNALIGGKGTWPSNNFTPAD